MSFMDRVVWVIVMVYLIVGECHGWDGVGGCDVYLFVEEFHGSDRLGGCHMLYLFVETFHGSDGAGGCDVLPFCG